MYAQAQKPKENKGSTVVNTVARKNEVKQRFGLIDNRTVAIAQRMLLQRTNSITTEQNKERSNPGCNTNNEHIQMMQNAATGALSTPNTKFLSQKNLTPIAQLKNYNKAKNWTETYNTKCKATDGTNSYFGYNGQPYTEGIKKRLMAYLGAKFDEVKQYMAPGSTLKDYMNSEGWTNFNCAEFIALDYALYYGANPAELTFKTVDRSGKDKAACSQCCMWLSSGKVKPDFLLYLD